MPMLQDKRQTFIALIQHPVYLLVKKGIHSGLEEERVLLNQVPQLFLRPGPGQGRVDISWNIRTLQDWLVGAFLLTRVPTGMGRCPGA